VFPLASRQGYSASLEVMDVAANIVAFEAINKVRLELRLSVVDRRGQADVVVVALAHSRETEIGEVPPLASVNVSCLGTRLRTMEACLIHALYQLDSKLAAGEFASTLSK
jgi:hypothetical protein